VLNVGAEYFQPENYGGKIEYFENFLIENSIKIEN